MSFLSLLLMLLMVFLQQWHQPSAKKLCPAIHYSRFSVLLNCRLHKILWLGCWVRIGAPYSWLVLFPSVRRNFRITQTKAFTQVDNKWKLFLWIILNHWWLPSCNMQCITWHSKNTCERTVQFQWGEKTALTSKSSFTGGKNRYIPGFVTNSWSTLTDCDLQFLNMQKIYIRFARCFEIQCYICFQNRLISISPLAKSKY